MRKCLRPEDSLFRFGGEEFLVLLSDTDCTAAAQVAERMRLAIEAMRFQIDDQPAPMTISAGAAVLREEETGEALVDRCDKQLYQAKRNGRNCVICG